MREPDAHSAEDTTQRHIENMNDIIDPRVNIKHQILVGQCYTDDRTEDRVTLVYRDNRHVLLKDEDEEHARLTRLKSFEREVGAGRYKVNGMVEVQSESAFTTIDFTKIDGVGNTTARALQAEGYTTTEDIKRADHDELLAVRGVGEGNLANIMEYIEDVDEQETL